MTTVIVGMLVVVLAAVVVLAVVAVPQLREGRRLLTPEGRQQVSHVRRRARSVAGQAKKVASGVADQAGQRAAEVGQSTRERVAARRQASQDAAEPLEREHAKPRARADAPRLEKPRAPKPRVEKPRVEKPRVEKPRPAVIDVRDQPRRVRPRAAARRSVLSWEHPQPGPRHARG